VAIRMLKDGRWICYYRERDTDTGKATERREYFGRGVEGQKRAQARHDALHLAKRRPARRHVGPVFADLARSYVQTQHLAMSTRDVLRYQLEAHIIPYFGHRDAIGLRFHDLDQYVHSRRAQVQDSTIRRELTAIQAILNAAVSRNPPLIPANPVRDYKKPKAYDAIIPPPSVDEVERILVHSADHLRRAIVLSYYLGLRPGAVELLSLTWPAVSWESEAILVTSAHKGGPTKRAVPIHPQLLPTLTGWFATDDGHGPIIHYRGKPIQSIKTAWRHALKHAKITRRLRPYDLRHAFATAALERDADIKALSEIMGSRPETLMRTYQHVSHRLRIDTVAKIPGLTICDQNPQKKAAPKSGLTY